MYICFDTDKFAIPIVLLVWATTDGKQRYGSRCLVVVVQRWVIFTFVNILFIRVYM